MEPSVLLAFISTFFFFSISPGSCMILSLTMGMTVGLKRALWMMGGELIGLGLIAISAVVGVATIMKSYPAIFIVFKLIGGLYITWLGVQMWISKGKMAINLIDDFQPEYSCWNLACQGFIAAVANPKAWALMI